MAIRKIKLKPIGECYVLSFLNRIRENKGKIEEAYNSMHFEFAHTPYFLPKEWWQNTIETKDLSPDYESEGVVMINGYWVPVSFILDVI